MLLSPGLFSTTTGWFQRLLRYCATILGSTQVHGRPAWKIAFADPQTPGFFTIWVDKANHRTLQLKMTATAHFMHHSYGPFNAPLKIQPPT